MTARDHGAAEHRYNAYPHPAGLVILDQVTGAISLVPADGLGVRELRGPQDHAARARAPVVEALAPTPRAQRRGAPLDEARGFATASTRRHLEALRARGVYRPEALVVGRAARLAVERFLRAEGPNPPEAAGQGLCVVGPSGVGKTSLLARTAEEHIESDVVVLCDVASLAGPDLEVAVARALQPPEHDRPARLTEVLLRLDEPARASGARLIVLVDGVEGFSASPFGHVASLLARLARYPWTRLVVSLQREPPGDASPRVDAPDAFVRCPVGPFSEEELVQAYRLLQARSLDAEGGGPRAAPTTPIDVLRDLPREARAVLCHPRTLRRIAERYDRRPLPLASLRAVAAALEVERLAAGTPSEVRAAAGMRGVALRMDDLGVDELAPAAVVSALAVSGTSGAEEAAQELVSRGWMTRVGGDPGRVRFADDALRDHWIVERFLQAHGDAAALSALARRWADVPRPAVPSVVLGLCLAGKAATILDAIDHPAAGDGLLDAVARALAQLGAVDDERLRGLVAALASRPGEGAMAVLVGALEGVLHRAVPSVLRLLVEAIDDAAEVPRLAAVTPSLRRRQRLAALRAYAALDRDDQVERVLSLLAHDDETSDDPEALVERAWLRREEAPALLERASSRGPVSSRAERLRAQLALDAGDLAAARQRAEAALAIGERSGDARERCAARMQLAWIERQAGDLDAFSHHLRGLLPLTEAIDDLALRRQALGTWAIERRERADYAGAITFAERALALALRADDPRPAQTALLNLGALRIDVGDRVGAESVLRQSAELARRLQRPRAEVLALVVLAEAERDRPDGRERALSTLDWALTIARRESIGTHEPRWSRWCLTRAEEDARAWQEAARSLAPTPLLEAQAAALAVDAAAREGSLAAVRERFDAVCQGLARQRPRPELQELPLAILRDVVELAVRRGALGFAAEVVDACRAWLSGRPALELEVVEARLRGAGDDPTRAPTLAASLR